VPPNNGQLNPSEPPGSNTKVTSLEKHAGEDVSKPKPPKAAQVHPPVGDEESRCKPLDTKESPPAEEDISKHNPGPKVPEAPKPNPYTGGWSGTNPRPAPKAPKGVKIDSTGKPGKVKIPQAFNHQPGEVSGTKPSPQYYGHHWDVEMNPALERPIDSMGEVSQGTGYDQKGVKERLMGWGENPPTHGPEFHHAPGKLPVFDRVVEKVDLRKRSLNNTRVTSCGPWTAQVTLRCREPTMG
jgi:hypothetical protein